MSLNNISLPSQLLADLYQKALVQSNASAMPVKPPVPFLGKNEKNILIVVSKKEAPYLPDDELAFLTNVLSACQLGLSDVAIVNWQKLEHHTPKDIFNQFITKKVILLDVEPSVLGLTGKLQPYTVINDDFCQFVVAPSLTDIEKSIEAKKQLWNALKHLFGI